MEKRRRKLNVRGNRFAPLQSKVCRRMKEGYVACPYEGKAQPTSCWGCGRLDRFFGTVLIKQHSLGGQKHGM